MSTRNEYLVIDFGQLKYGVANLTDEQVATLTSMQHAIRFNDGQFQTCIASCLTAFLDNDKLSWETVNAMPAQSLPFIEQSKFKLSTTQNNNV